jgi:hypothetical protein
MTEEGFVHKDDAAPDTAAQAAGLSPADEVEITTTVRALDRLVRGMEMCREDMEECSSARALACLLEDYANMSESFEALLRRVQKLRAKP